MLYSSLHEVLNNFSKVLMNCWLGTQVASKESLELEDNSMKPEGNAKKNFNESLLRESTVKITPIHVLSTFQEL